MTPVPLPDLASWRRYPAPAFGADPLRYDVAPGLWCVQGQRESGSSTRLEVADGLVSDDTSAWFPVSFRGWGWVRLSAGVLSVREGGGPLGASDVGLARPWVPRLPDDGRYRWPVVDLSGARTIDIPGPAPNAITVELAPGAWTFTNRSGQCGVATGTNATPANTFLFHQFSWQMLAVTSGVVTLVKLTGGGESRVSLAPVVYDAPERAGERTSVRPPRRGVAVISAQGMRSIDTATTGDVITEQILPGVYSVGGSGSGRLKFADGTTVDDGNGFNVPRNGELALTLSGQVSSEKLSGGAASATVLNPALVNTPALLQATRRRRGGR